MSHEPALAVEAKELTRRFGSTLAVDRLTLAVRPGEVFGLVGPDGAGKTTAMRLLTGVMAATSGTALVLGLDVTRDPEAVRPRIGYVPQSSSLYADLTVLENLRFHADLFGIPRAERLRKAEELLAFSRLEAFGGRLARQLSGGMRQKLALCVALIHRPEVLFLDEPTIGVDPVSRRDFWLLIYQLVQQGVTLLVSTPYLDEAERCHRVGLMHRGRLVACDTPAGIRRLHSGALLEARGDDLEAAAPLLRRLPGVRDVQTFGDTLHVAAADGVDADALAGAIRAAGLPALTLRPIAPGLEDVFVALLREEKT
ncbi:MAG: ABC transporter ATP-binding protein [Candidatus Methylomirabilales bacterium]